ncbi:MULTISPECIES: palindromic element RPE3 domain-containing protein [unclassified Rickettsia]|uniref:palindromic element RPE3 domain-containing protein n=1 Tax=unclassified Rickettsia TaxID=114295 RepID=UPI00313318AE
MNRVETRIFNYGKNIDANLKNISKQIDEIKELLDIQLNSESFRQDKFKDELSYRTKVGEYRRMSKNLLVSSDRDDAVFPADKGFISEWDDEDDEDYLDDKGWIKLPPAKSE